MASNDDTSKLPKRDPVEEAHFRIDELVRENTKLKQMVSVEHITGVAHGAAADYADRLQVGNSAVVAKIELLVEEIRQLIATLSTPAVRTATLELPSGPATMTVTEKRHAVPWRKQ
jgi:hypothetical protein